MRRKKHWNPLKNAGWNLSNRCKAFLLVLLCIFVHLSATDLTSMVISTGNDWFTLGIGDNDDDALSYGLNFTLGMDSGLHLEMDVLGYTDKQVYSKRYDVLNTFLMYPWTFETEKNEITLTALVGMTVSGNLGFSGIQNLFHAMNSLSAVTLDYETSQSMFHPMLGGEVKVMHQFKYLSLGFEAIAAFAPAWEGSIQTNAVAEVGDIMDLKVGYQIIHGYSHFTSQNHIDDLYTGLNISFTYDGGIFQTTWIHYPESNISYGTLGFDLLAFKAPPQFHEADYTFSTGFRVDQNGNFLRSFVLLDKGFLFEVRHKNGPLLPDVAHQGERMTIAGYFLGYQSDILSQHFITPYVKALAGLQRFNLNHNYTTRLIETLLPVCGAELGIRIGKNGQWQAGRQSYRFRVSASALYVFGTDTIPYEKDFNQYIGPWLLNVGFALDIEHDLITE